MSENTTVIVSKETRDALKALGRKGESYDDVIRRLIEYHNQGVSAASSLLKPVADESKEKAEG